jgi:hypothetical protein
MIVTALACIPMNCSSCALGLFESLTIKVEIVNSPSSPCVALAEIFLTLKSNFVLDYQNHDVVG